MTSFHPFFSPFSPNTKKKTTPGGKICLAPGATQLPGHTLVTHEDGLGLTLMGEKTNHDQMLFDIANIYIYMWIIILLYIYIQ